MRSSKNSSSKSSGKPRVCDWPAGVAVAQWVFRLDGKCSAFRAFRFKRAGLGGLMNSLRGASWA